MGCNDSKPLPELRESDIARFWSFVDKTPGHGPNGDCWPWTVGTFPGGYGSFSLHGRNVRASRVAWLLATGDDPYPLNILHRCDFPRCTRFSHFRAGSHGDNTIDAMRKGRLRNGSAHRRKPIRKEKAVLSRDLRRFTFKPIPDLSIEQAALFWSCVDKRGPDECWPWLGDNRDRDGYGHIFHLVASRVAYKIQKGEDPGPFYVCHSCDSPPCVNGVHLFRGTQGQNMGDASRKGHLVSGERHWTRRLPDSQVGERNHYAKLTAKQVIEMRKMHRDNPDMPQRRIAEKYGIDPMHLHNILIYRAWKHLPIV